MLKCCVGYIKYLAYIKTLNLFKDVVCDSPIERPSVKKYLSILQDVCDSLTKELSYEHISIESSIDEIVRKKEVNDFNNELKANFHIANTEFCLCLSGLDRPTKATVIELLSKITDRVKLELLDYDRWITDNV